MKDNWNAYVNGDLEIEPTGVGVLNNLTFAIKDVFAIEGYRCGAGSPDWLCTHGPAEQTAPLIEKLLQQGAKLKGTTHTDELMYSLNGENFHYGTPVNPIASERIPGGSSSGSAVVVSAGLVDFALGSDTGGSVRITSSYCGVYGIRPTHGAVSIEGVVPLAMSFDTVGWMARDPKILLDVGEILIDGQEATDGHFSHIFFGQDAWEVLDDKYKEAFSNSILSIQEIADNYEWVKISEQGLSEWGNTFRILQGLEIWEEHGEWIQKENPKFGPGVAERFSWASTLNKAENKHHFELREEIRRFMYTLLGEKGLLVIPTAPEVAPFLNLQGEKMKQYREKTMQLTCIAGLAGLPQVTLTLINVNGLPIGLSIIANRNQDKNLLLWASQFSQKMLSLNLKNF
ncbi:amidase [Peribacillus frigoritolerans]|uniref:amidase n=1 Tax=Peribacillus frigoritolerans TaxID=450367 RepID=UPI003F7DBDB8